MEALRESLLEQSDLKRRFQTSQQQQNKKKLLSSLLPPLHKNERVVIHSAISNEGKTHDGIEAGGKRVANEINNLVQELWNKQEEQSHQSNNNNQIRLSLIGNSLGGLYARYALSEIQWTGFASNNNKNKKKKKKKLLIPHHFITTSTPHLGCGFQQTYLPLPRFIENPIAHVMQQSGKDLFRFTNVVDDMTFQSKFIQPLSKFQQRIAYINVHGTDFQVPTPTAAFWGDTDSIHYVIEEEKEQDDDHNIVNDDLEESSSSSDDDSEISAATDDKQEADKNNNNKGWPSGIVMKLATMPQTKRKRNEKEEESKLENDDENDDDNDDESSTCTTTASAEVLSLKLDQLGWTKVLVDVRNEMPLSFRRSSSSSLSTSEQQPPDKNDNDGKVETTNDKTKKKEWTSRELLAEFDTGRLQSIPLGHTVLVANSKNDIYRKINKAGIPIMDHLAKELINST
eukprot:scaffold779_cov92-Cylindrotheca_fusiformis.AAC.3